MDDLKTTLTISGVSLFIVSPPLRVRDAYTCYRLSYNLPLGDPQILHFYESLYTPKDYTM